MELKPNYVSRKNLGEGGVTEALVGDYVAKGSIGYNIINEYFNKQVTVNRMISLALLISKRFQLPLPRNFKRSKVLMYKWFTIHCEEVKNFLPCIKPVYEN